MSKEDDPGVKFFDEYVAQKQVTLSGVDWGMVVSTLEESADNCFRCKNKGCGVCEMTRRIAANIGSQIKAGAK